MEYQRIADPSLSSLSLPSKPRSKLFPDEERVKDEDSFFAFTCGHNYNFAQFTQEEILQVFG